MPLLLRFDIVHNELAGLALKNLHLLISHQTGARIPVALPVTIIRFSPDFPSKGMVRDRLTLSIGFESENIAGNVAGVNVILAPF